MSNQIIDVLVVGAGPVGLVSAILLARAGLRVRIIDKALERCPFSRAFGVSARTMELLALLGGVDTSFAKIGQTPTRVRHRFASSEVVWKLDSTVKGCLQPTLILSQDQQEKILEQHLNFATGVELERGIELVNLFQTEALVAARLKNLGTGQEETVEAKYLIGADGGKSTVRHLLEIPFEGSMDRGVVWFADAKEDPPRRDDLNDVVGEIHHHKAGRLLRFKFGDNVCRYICFMPHVEDPQAPTWDQFKAEVAKRSFDPINLVDPTWITALKFNYRVAKKYSKGRVYLAGDAAHVHSPVGGQGMNMGVQDAFNLCWRLAGVVKGLYPAPILAQHEQERRPVALDTVKAVQKGTKFAFKSTFAHGLVIRGIAFLACRLESFRTKLILSLLQLNLRYKTGEEIWRGVDTMETITGDSGPGCRCPNVELIDHEEKPTTLHKQLATERCTLIYFDGVAQEREDDELWSEISAKMSLHLMRVCFTTAKEVKSSKIVRTRNCNLTRCLFVRSESNAVYLIRPDAVIMFRMRPVHLLRLAAAIERLTVAR